MKVITDIRAYRGQMIIYAEGERALCVRKADFAQLPVCVGEEIDIDDYKNRLSARQFDAAREAAVTLLAASDKTSAAIVKKLRDSGFMPDAAEAAAAWLKERGFLDDARFTSEFVEQAQERGMGESEIRRRLRERGVERDIASSIFIDPKRQIESARELYREYFEKYGSDSSYKTRMKICQALYRRGFTSETISAASLTDEYE